MAAKLWFLLIVMFVAQVQGNKASLHRHLFNAKKYSNRVRPAANASDSLNVTFGLALHEIIDLNDMKQRLTLRITIRQYWFDSSLSWNKSDFGGVEDITVHPDTIWIPDIVLFNNAGEGFGDGVTRTQAVIRHDGLVRMNIPSILKSTCKVHLANYPFDEQTCSIKFGSWLLDASQVGLVLESSSADLSWFITNVEWKLLDIPGKFQSSMYACCPHPFHDIEYLVKMKRRSLFHAMYLIIPCAVISLLTLLVFVLPPECNERMTVGMTILVGLSFFFLLVAENMPATSDTVPVIGIYYSVTLLEVSAAFFMTCFVLMCHHHNPTDGDLPDWVRRYLRRPARILGFPFDLRRDPKQTMETHDEDSTANHASAQLNAANSDQDLVRRKSALSSKQQETPKEKDADRILQDHVAMEGRLEKRQEDWRMAALVLNSISMWIYIFAVVVTLAVVLVPQFMAALF